MRVRKVAIIAEKIHNPLNVANFISRINHQKKPFVYIARSRCVVQNLVPARIQQNHFLESFGG